MLTVGVTFLIYKKAYANWLKKTLVKEKNNSSIFIMIEISCNRELKMLRLQ